MSDPALLSLSVSLSLSTLALGNSKMEGPGVFLLGGECLGVTEFWGVSHGSWVMGHGSWVMGHGSWVMGHGSWVMGREARSALSQIDDLSRSVGYWLEQSRGRVSVRGCCVVSAQTFESL
jgi:hypothetical protein